jgi:hypothetical protein
MSATTMTTKAQAPRRCGRADAATTGLSIVVPVFNEAGGLALHARIAEIASRLRSAGGWRRRSSMSTTAAATIR